METVAQLLAPGGGRLILRDFHPVSTKLISSRGKKHKATGNYFDTGARVCIAYIYQRAAGRGAADGKQGVLVIETKSRQHQTDQLLVQEAQRHLRLL
jgi:hypothetical protein